MNGGSDAEGNSHCGRYYGLPHYHCPHASKCYKALIDSGAAISLIRYSTYQHMDNSFKTPIQPTTAKLNTADGSLMTSLGMTALHLRIADVGWDSSVGRAADLHARGPGFNTHS